jgi:hypothetical protein
MDQLSNKHGSLEVGVIVHERNYAKGLTETPIWSARSPFGDSRKRLKSIVTKARAEFWQRFFVMKVSNSRSDVDVYVDINSGEQVINAIPVLTSRNEFVSNQISPERFVLLFFSMNTFATEDVSIDIDKHNILWKVFYSNEQATEGVAISALNGQPIFAEIYKVSK